MCQHRRWDWSGQVGVSTSEIRDPNANEMQTVEGHA